MSKPRTMGDVIGVRLPLSEDALIRALAEAEGLSPGKWLQRFTENHLHTHDDVLRNTD